MKRCRFQGHSRTTRHWYVVRWVHHAKSRVLPSPFGPSTAFPLGISTPPSVCGCALGCSRVSCLPAKHPSVPTRELYTQVPVHSEARNTGEPFIILACQQQARDRRYFPRSGTRREERTRTPCIPVVKDSGKGPTGDPPHRRAGCEDRGHTGSVWGTT